MPVYAPGIIEEVRAAADLVAVVSHHVALKRVGKNLVGLCPFHKEKSPSFNVNPHKQFYKCYGCGEGGDVISFVRKTTGLGFQETLQQLAQQFHVALPEPDERTERRTSERDQLHKVNAWAVEHFQRNLKGSPGLAYLQSRGLTPESIAGFHLGWAGDSWDALLKASPFPVEVLEKAGLVLPGKDGRGHYDRFRGRVIFPIFDPQARPIAFGARILGPDRPGEPKYLNSPATPVFSKSAALYGLEKAGNAVRSEGRVAVMEGYTDVILSHQAGVAWTVATLGTALTAEHAGVLKRYTDQVVLVYDADAAGKKAADRGLDVLLQANFLVRVCTLPEGEDPADFFAHADARGFASRVAEALELVDYRIDSAKRSGRFATVKEQADVLSEILQTAASIPDPAQRELMVKRVSERTGVTETALWQRLKGREAPPVREAPGEAPVRRATPSGSAALEHALLGVLLHDPMIILNDPDPERVGSLVLQNESLGEAFRTAFIAGIARSAGGPWDPQGFLASLGEDEEAKRAVVEAWDAEVPGADPVRVWNDCLRRLEGRRLESERSEMERRSRLGEDPEAFRRLVETHRRRVGVHTTGGIR